MDLDEHDPPRSYELPTTPLYHSKGRCGAKAVPLIEVPENATVVGRPIWGPNPRYDL